MKQAIKEAALNNYKELYEGEPLTHEVPIDAFIKGAKWQQENSYSEEDLEYAFEQGKLNSNICYRRTFRNVLEILQFKKK